MNPSQKGGLRVQGKAQTDSKAEHTRKYVSILNRFATPPWALRRIFEMGSRIIRLVDERMAPFFPARNGAFLWKEKLLKIVDISVPISAGLPVWPGDPQIEIERYRLISDGNNSNNSRITCSVHSGTHVDAPAHFIENGASGRAITAGDTYWAGHGG